MRRGSEENLLKRYLKRRVKITLGVIVGFLITGSVISANDIIEINYKADKIPGITTNVPNISENFTQKQKEEFETDVSGKTDDYWKIIINKSISNIDNEKKVQEGTLLNHTISFNNIGDYISDVQNGTISGGEKGEALRKAKEELDNAKTEKDKKIAEENYVAKVQSLLAGIRIQNNGVLYNGEDKDVSGLNQCNIHSDNDNAEIAIIGTVVNNGVIATKGKTNIGAENKGTGNSAIAHVINQGKLELVDNNNQNAGRHNIYSYSSGNSGNSYIGLVVNNGIISAQEKKGNILDNTLKAGSSNIISESEHGDSLIKGVINNGSLVDASINIASSASGYTASNPDKFTMSRINNIKNTGVMIGSLNIYNQNNGNGEAEISGIVNTGGMYAMKNNIGNDILGTNYVDKTVAINDVKNYGTMRSFVTLVNVDGNRKQDTAYSIIFNTIRSSKDVAGPNSALEGNSIVKGVVNYGKMEAAGDTFYIGASKAETDVNNQGLALSSKENVFHIESGANNSSTENKFTFTNSGTAIGERSFLWFENKEKNKYNIEINNNGIIAARRIFMSNKEHENKVDVAGDINGNDGNYIYNGMGMDSVLNDQSDNHKLTYTTNGIYIIINNNGYINNIITPNTPNEVEIKYKDNEKLEKFTVKNADILKTEFTLDQIKVKPDDCNLSQDAIKGLFDNKNGNYVLKDGVKELLENPIYSDNKKEFDQKLKELGLNNINRTDFYKYFSKFEGNLFGTKSFTKNDFTNGEIKNHILNGADNTLLVDGDIKVENSIINAYETSVKFNNSGALTLNNSIVNGGVKIGEKDTNVSGADWANKSDIITIPYIIEGDKNNNSLNIGAGTIINGGIGLGAGNDTVNIAGKEIYINGEINADLTLEDLASNTVEKDKDTLNITGKDTNLNIFNDVFGFENTKIDGSNVTIFERVSYGKYGTDKPLTFQGGDITVSNNGSLTLRIDSTDVIRNEHGNLVYDHALFGNKGNISLESGGTFNIDLGGLGWQTYINLGGTSITGKPSSDFVDKEEIEENNKENETGSEIVDKNENTGLADKHYANIDVTSAFHSVRFLTDEEKENITASAKDGTYNKYLKEEINRINEEIGKLTSIDSPDNKTRLEDLNAKKDVLQDQLDNGISAEALENFLVVDVNKNLNECIDMEDYLKGSNVKYEQLNNIYKDILNSGNIDKFKVGGITEEEKKESFGEFLRYLREIYTETPYSFTSELSRKSLGTFRDSIVDFPFMANEDNWLIYGGLTHVDGGTKEEYYGKNFYGFDTGTSDVKADMSTTGAYALAEYGHTPYVATGLVVGGANNKLDLSNGSNSEGDMAYIGAYIKRDKDDWRWIAGAGVQWGDYDSERQANRRLVCGKDYDENFEAHHHDRAYDVFAKGTYTYKLNDEWALQPHIAGSYTWLKQNSIHEKERRLAIDVDEKKFEYGQVEAGLELKREFRRDDETANLKFGVSYKYLLSGYEDEYLHGKYQNYVTGGDINKVDSQKGFDMLVPEKNRGYVEASIKYEVEKDNGYLYDIKGSYAFEVNDRSDVRYDSRSKNYRDGEWLIGVGFGYKFNDVKELVVNNVVSNFVFNASALFDFDKSEIKPEGKEVIKNASQAINKEKIEGTLLIEGHTDWKGSEKYNQKLSEKRAEAVKEEFKANVTNEKIKYEAKGYGETRPIATNETPEGRAKNRRVEVNYIKN